MVYNSLDTSNHPPHVHYHGAGHEHGDVETVDDFEQLEEEDLLLDDESSTSGEEEDVERHGGGLGFNILDVEKGVTLGSPRRESISDGGRFLVRQRSKRRLFDFPLHSPRNPNVPASAWQSLDVYQSLANVTRHPSMVYEVGGWVD